ncbi:hypothetical protein Tco_1016572 [Tanacetum coccineum]|uniref:Uncharacterized protein n=1 Tax=Tanacetum coccineum TaxID=301880 RepID=A0ABQ5FRK6_9ASTR
MAYWKSMNLKKLVINDEMTDYVLEKCMNKWHVDDIISDKILNDLLKRKLEKQHHLKDDKKGHLKGAKGKGLLNG